MLLHQENGPMLHSFSHSSSNIYRKKIIKLRYSSILTEIFRVSGMISNQGLNDYDRLQRGSPSPVSSDIMPNYRGTGLGSWHGLPHDVSIRNFVTSGFAILFLKVFQFLRPLTYLTIV